MALPKQVQRDAEEIAAYEAAMAAEREGAVVPEAQTEVTEAVIADPVEPVVVVPEIGNEQVSNVVELKPDSEEAKWKHKFLTLQGINQAEAKTHREVRQQLDRYKSELEDLKAVPITVPSLISDAEVVEFGADLIDVQRRVTKEELTPILAQLEHLRQENNFLREQQGQTESRLVSSNFEQRLAVQVPDFEAVNADPRWVAWLDEIDPVLRAPRRVVAQAAYERGDVEATAAYVGLFRALGKPVAPVRSNAAAELQSQVTPSRSSSNATAGDTPPRIYTEIEAGQLFDRVGLLYRQGKTDEAQKLDVEMTAAYHEGRVR